MKTDGGRVVHRALGGGRWFPGSREALGKAVAQYMDGASVTGLAGRIVAGFAPHAGYQYSGPVAGYTFRALRDAAASGQGPETVVILGFSHHEQFSGVALMDGDAIATPLGETPLDKEAGQALVDASQRIRFSYAPHQGEHSAENEIPFVQAACPKARLVVGLMGDHDMKTIDECVAALLKLGEKRRLVVVASSDMLHDPDYALVARTDKASLEKVRAMDDAGLLQDWTGAHQTFCGICPVVTVMRYARALGCKQPAILRYRNSGDDFPESRGQWVVGYGAVVFTAPAAGAK